MSQSDIALILKELEEIKEQVIKTNGRVTRLERGVILVLGIAIGAGLLKAGHLSIFGM